RTRVTGKLASSAQKTRCLSPNNSFEQETTEKTEGWLRLGCRGLESSRRADRQPTPSRRPNPQSEKEPLLPVRHHLIELLPLVSAVAQFHRLDSPCLNPGLQIRRGLDAHIVVPGGFSYEHVQEHPASLTREPQGRL